MMAMEVEEEEEFDLEALQRELESVQAEVAVQKLSERNCIEIVNTLCELGEIDLIYTQVQYSTVHTARHGAAARHGTLVRTKGHE